MNSKTKTKTTKNGEKNEQLEDKTPPKMDESNELEGDIHNESHEEINENQRNTEPSDIEKYLLNKLNKMKISNNLVNSISSNLGNSLTDVQKDIKDNQVSIREIPNDENIKRLLEKNDDGKNKKSIEQNILSKRNLKKLKEYYDEKDKLNEKLFQLENQKLFLENETEKNNNLSKIDESIQKEELKKLRRDVSIVNERICQIDYQIKNIILEESKLNKDEQIKKFLDNFKRDTQIVQIKLRKFKKQHEEQEKVFKENEEKYHKNIERYNLREKKKEEKKKNKVKERVKEELEEIGKAKEKYKEIKQKDEEILKKLEEENKYFNIKNNKYYFKELLKKYQNKEKKYIEKVLKEYCEENHKKQLIDFAEFKGMSSYKQIQKELSEKQQEKTEKKIEEKKREWENNKSKIPEFKSKFSAYALYQSHQIEEDKKKEENDFKEKQKKREKLLKEIKIPEKDEEKIKERLENIKKADGIDKEIKHYTMLTNKNKRILLKKRDPNKPSKYNWELKLDEIDNENPLGTSVELQKALKKKPKRIMLSTEFEKKIEIPNQKIDYLPDVINKLNTKTEMNNENDNTVISNKWNKMIKDKNGNLQDNLENVKFQADLLEKKAVDNERVLVVNGGFSKNPKLGKKVGNLLINSIQAKMCILDTFDN
jgi:hypothetical protein